MERPKVLLMFSGGKGSLLSAIELMRNGYKVLLMTFDNGNILPAVDNSRLINIVNFFGKDKIEYIGVLPSIDTYRHNTFATGNKLFSEIIDEYGDISARTMNCLNCKTSMYTEAVLYCLEHEIYNIADGARKSKNIPFQQSEIIDEYRSFLGCYGINLLLPVYDLSDWDFDNLFMAQGILSKTGDMAWSCLSNLFEHQKIPASDREISTSKKILQKTLIPRAKDYLENGYMGSRPPRKCEPSKENERYRFM